MSRTQEQEALVGLAAEILAGRTSNDQLAALEKTESRFDAELWRELADAGLLGIAVPEEHGGAGLGLTEVCLLLEQHGRFLALVPLWETLAAALLVAEGASPDVAARVLPAVASGALRLSVKVDLGGGDGLVSGPADAVVVVEGGAVSLVEGADLTTVLTTNHTLGLELSGGSASPLTVSAARARLVVRLALAAVQLGVADAGVREAAAYLSEREQFGRPLGTFQATQQQLGDAYCEVQAMRATLGQALFTLADVDVDVACWWATESAERIQHSVQHLHGGMGADITYPVHRRLLWTMRNNALLGGPSRQLVRLGAQLT
jgi:alkylation response protein AidB-like acyl-CoA dehydrogenase